MNPVPIVLEGRGERREGEVPALIADELARRGVARERIANAPSELDAMKLALAWSRPGDLLLFLSHSEREAALELLEGLHVRGWGPGEPLGA